MTVEDCFSTKAHAHLSLCQCFESKRKRYTFKRLNASNLCTGDSFSGCSYHRFLATRRMNETSSFRFKDIKRPNAFWDAKILVPDFCSYEEISSPSVYLPHMFSDIALPLVTSDFSSVISVQFKWHFNLMSGKFYQITSCSE